MLDNGLQQCLTRKHSGIEKVGSVEQLQHLHERLSEHIKRCSQHQEEQAEPVSYLPSKPNDRVALVNAALQRCEANAKASDDREAHEGWTEALEIWTGQWNSTDTGITTDYLR